MAKGCRVAMFSKQNPPNCYSKLAFRRGPPLTIAFRGIKYTLFWQGSPDKIHITWAKWGRLNLLTWKTTRGNRAKVARLRGKTTDLATLSRVDLFWGIGCDSTTWASYQETKSGPSVWRPRCGSARCCRCCWGWAPPPRWTASSSGHRRSSRTPWSRCRWPRLVQADGCQALVFANESLEPIDRSHVFESIAAASLNDLNESVCLFLRFSRLHSSTYKKRILTIASLYLAVPTL